MPVLLDLFLTFFKIGAFTFGGGYAMIPVISDICVVRKKWITDDEMMTVTIIAESTPGPMAINCATFVGHKKAGLPGSIISTIGIVLPSFLVIFIISILINNFLDIPLVSKAFKGIKIAVGILILYAAVNMIKKAKKKKLTMSILISSACVMMLINIFSIRFSSILLMLIAGLTGLILSVSLDLKNGRGGGRR